MPTVKELKKELKEKEIPYPKDALKADLELLLEAKRTMEEKEAPKDDAEIDTFIDPNADPETQA